MSPRASSRASRRVAVPKAKNDIYTALLAIALGAIITACILLGIEMNRYGWKVKPSALEQGVQAVSNLAALDCQQLPPAG